MIQKKQLLHAVGDPQVHLETVDGRHGRITFFRTDLVLGRALRSYGEWAENEITFIKRLISTGDTILDVGANIGTHTLAFARKVGARGTVIAIEPCPEIFDLLRRNVEQNGLPHVLLEQAAAGAEAKKIEVPAFDIEASQNFGGLNLQSEMSAEATALAGTPEFRRVPVLTIDSFALSACHFIKIDVEGAESEVLAGATQTIRNYKPFIYAECNTLEGGVATKTLLDALGYTCFLHLADAYNPNNYLGSDENWFGNAREAAIFGVHTDRIDTILDLMDEPNELILRIVDADAIAFGLLQKPQFFTEALSVSSAGRAYQTRTRSPGEPARSLALKEAALAEVAELRVQIAALERSNVGDQKALQSLREAIASLTAQRDKVIAELTVSESDYKAQIAALESLTAQRDKVVAELTASETEYRAQIAGLERRNADHRETLQSLREFVVGLSDRFAGMVDPASEKLWPRQNRFNRFTTLIKSVLPKRNRKARDKELNAIRRSPFFDAAYYRQVHPDVKDKGVEPAAHYFRFGSAEGRNPGPFFSTKLYMSANLDVASSGMTALGHYELFGRAEKRALPFSKLESPNTANGGRAPFGRSFPLKAKRQQNAPAKRLDEGCYITTHPDLEMGAHPPLDASVSVVIPTFNAGSELYSLISKLNQQKGLLRGVEVVIVDSGSHDGTRNLRFSWGARSFR